MILKEEKLAQARDYVLQTIAPAALAKESQETYLQESISPAEEGEDGKPRTYALNGIFITPELNWDVIIGKLGNNYKPRRHPAEEAMEERMGLKNVFPPKTIVRGFQQIGVESFCKVEIKFNPQLLSKLQAIYHLERVRERARETREWAKPLKDWLESQKMPDFYNVVEFEIVGEFDFTNYWRAREQVKEAPRSVSRLTRAVQKEARAQLQKEAIELAEWAIEYVTKEKVFPDLCDAISALYETDSQEEKSTPRRDETKAIKEKPGEKKPSPESASTPKHRILIYKPVNLELIIDIHQPNQANDKERLDLAEKIMATIELRNYNTKQEITVDKYLKVVIQSRFFEGKTVNFEDELRTKQEGGSPWSLSENGDHRKILMNQETLQPNVTSITTDYKKTRKCPITFSLIRSVSDTVSGGAIQYCKTEKLVRFDLPTIRFSVTSQYFPRKGEQFDVDFVVACKSGSTLKDYTIPVRVECYPGDGFSTLEPLSGSSKTITRSLDIQVEQNGGGAPARFTLTAKKAGFLGYYNSVYFKFYVGQHSEAVKEWRLNTIVLPNLLDTLVAGGTGLLGILSVAYPEIFPAITQGLSIANLEIIPATIYLVYRVLNWSKKTSSES